MQNIRKMSALLGAGAVILSLAGCADKNNNGMAETPAEPDKVGNAVADNLGDTANAVVKGADKVGNAVVGAGSAVGNVVSNDTQAVGNAVSNGVKAVDNGAAKLGADATALNMTPKIKTAFGGTKGLNGSDINVNTDVATKTVTLEGTVKSAAQKTLASAIAKKNGTGMTIKNNLKIGK